jgi:hypothetical protein
METPKSRSLSIVPAYLRHRQSGKARVVVYDHHGNRKQILLPGEFNSNESLDEYHRTCALVRSNSGRLPGTKSRGVAVDLTNRSLHGTCQRLLRQSGHERAISRDRLFEVGVWSAVSIVRPYTDLHRDDFVRDELVV